MDPLDGRLTVVSAAAGYGKTTAVRAWLGDTPARWLRGTDLADGEQVVVDGGQVTVIDDVHLAPDDLPTPKLADDARLILITRTAPPDAARPAAETGAAALLMQKSPSASPQAVKEWLWPTPTPPVGRTDSARSTRPGAASTWSTAPPPSPVTRASSARSARARG